jgi:hypothetical protein
VSKLFCRPVSGYWKFPPPPNAQCLDDRAITVTGAIINNCADLMVTIFPIPLVLRLQLSKRHLWITTGLFGLGFIASIASILRTYYLWSALYKSFDISWLSTPLYIACAVEINLGIVKFSTLFDVSYYLTIVPDMCVGPRLSATIRSNMECCEQ